MGASHHAAKVKRGPRGPRGRRGPRGFRGARGPQGLEGAAGPAGPRGIQGARGAKGDTGARGLTIEIRDYCARANANPYAYPDAPCRAQSYAVDSQDNVGWTPSIAIGIDGNPVISYAKGSTGDLKVARCNDPLCSNGDETLSTVESADDVGREDSLAIAADGNPVVRYYAISSHTLKVAPCNDPACVPGGETLTAVDRTGVVGEFSSLAIGADGNPVISYLDATNVDLKVARCNDPGCTGENETL